MAASQIENGAGAVTPPNGHATLSFDSTAVAGSGATGGQVDALHSIVASHDGTPPQQAAPQEGTPAEQPTDSTVQEEQHSEHPVLDEFELELKKAQDNPSDFNQWVAVEKLVDKLGDIEKTRRVYDGLLAEFPLCFGYWRKYADAEHKLSSPEWAINVFDRGVAAVPYSADLWGYYCNYKQKLGVGPDELRQLFEQGIAYVGTDYLAHGLWDKYIKYETAQGAFANVTRLCLRILGSPLKEIDRYFESLKQFAEQRPALDLMTADELTGIADSLKEAKRAAAAAAAAMPAANGDVAMETEEAVANGESAAAAAKGPQEVGTEAAAAAAEVEVDEPEIKAHWLSGVEALYNETKAELEQRKVFEDAIKRPYFHVKPLDQNQLTAWNSYIDYVLQKQDAGVIVRLFERCLVACASYPEFWIRYVRYLSESDPGTAPAAIYRAAQVHCKRNPVLHLFAAKFHERRGDVAAARGSYQTVLTQLSPGLVEAVVQWANFERRQKDQAAAQKAFEDSLAAEEGKEGTSDNGAMLAMFYAQFLHLTCRDAAAARSIYERALKRWTGLRYLWEGAIHFEEHCLELERTERVLDLYRRATATDLEGETRESTLSDTDVKELSQRYVDFADAWLNPEDAEKVAVAHEARFSKYAKPSPLRKRPAEGAAGDEAAAKRIAVDGGAEHATAADPNAASGAAADPSAATGDATAAVAQAAYYPTASAAAYGYNYYQYPQQYGYTYTGY